MNLFKNILCWLTVILCITAILSPIGIALYFSNGWYSLLVIPSLLLFGWLYFWLIWKISKL